MTSRFVFRMSLVALGVSAALGANSAWAQDAGTPPPSGAEGEVEDMGVITVTGSRTITEAVRSPTPITSVDIGAIAVTTPSDTADALNKLPNILGGRTPRTQGNGANNNGGNVLSLRNFGVSRTLVLVDGHRVAPNNQDGTVNIDVLPQMLMERVDIVTGGASAVYGSDAVAGVVNFVLDKDFTGFSFKSDYGKSKYGDGDEYQLGAAWGTTLFNDRGHFEIAARTRHQDMIPMSDRPYGENGQSWLLTGNGSPGNRFTNTPYARLYNTPDTGNVICGIRNAGNTAYLNPCGRNDHTFSQNGVLSASPLAHGTPSGTGNVESGGSGGYIKYGTFRSEVEMKDVFTRFSLDLGDSANWYVQGSWAQAENASNWIQWVVSPNPGRPSTLFANNPYLSADTQTQMGANVDCSTLTVSNPDGWRCLPAAPTAPPSGGGAPPPPPTTPWFTVPSFTFNRVDGVEADLPPNRLYRTLADQKNWNVETGVTGEIGSWSWDVYGSHSESNLRVTNPNNTDNAKYLAALDAVDDNGTIRCWVSTQPAFASLYPGCVPINVVNPNGPSSESYEYLRRSTSWLLTQEMDNVGASIGGGLWGFGLPAGEIVASLSVDARWSTYVMESNALPTEFVDCTGLRMCRASNGTSNNPGPAPLRWVQNTNAEVDAKNHVYEAALEFNVPLLKEVPGFQDLSTNFAGRWSKYSTFDAVESWKIGLNWQVIDSLRIRSTLSSDIRAPNLNDLYQPAGVTSTGFNDRLTGGTAQGMRLVTRGNPLLTPETAKTFTAGIVVTPSFVPRLSVAVDFYETRLTNAITQISYQSDAIQAVCIATAPAYNSPICDLAVRPLSPGDANYLNPNFNLPTEIRNSPVNAALQKTRGFDVQLDYSWDMGAGQFALRHLASYQPTNSTLTTPASTFYVWAVQPKLMQTTMLSYENSGWNLALQNRWLSSVSLKSSDNNLNGNSQNYVDSSLDSYNVVDTTISKDFEVSGGNMEAFLTVNNLLNEHAPLYPSNSNLPGLFYPTLPFYDDMGRFYTAGIKLKF
jgi:iron complex outermembrane recepter protein